MSTPNKQAFELHWFIFLCYVSKEAIWSLISSFDGVSCFQRISCPNCFNKLKKIRDVKTRACVNFDRNSWTRAAREPLMNFFRIFFLFWPRIAACWSFWFDNDTSWQSIDQPMINLIAKQGSSMRGLDGESSYQAGLSCYPLILRSSHDLLSHFLTVLPQKWKKYIVTENSRQILLRNLYTSFDR